MKREAGASHHAPYKGYVEIISGPAHSAAVKLVTFGRGSNRPGPYGHSLILRMCNDRRGRKKRNSSATGNRIVSS